MVALTEQIAEFTRLLPQLRKDYGSAWAILVNSQVKAAFPTFEEAAKFAIANFNEEQFLIRHTDEERETIPFVLVEH